MNKLPYIRPPQACYSDPTIISMIPVSTASVLYVAHKGEQLLGNTPGVLANLPYFEYYSSVALGGVSALAGVIALGIGKKLSRNVAELGVGTTRALNCTLGAIAAGIAGGVVEGYYSTTKPDPTDLLVGTLAAITTAALMRVSKEKPVKL